MIDRIFPWRCPVCKNKTVVHQNIKYKSDVKRKGKMHHIVIDNLSVPKCTFCGEILFDNEADKQIVEELKHKGI